MVAGVLPKRHPHIISAVALAVDNLQLMVRMALRPVCPLKMCDTHLVNRSSVALSLYPLLSEFLEHLSQRRLTPGS